MNDGPFTFPTRAPDGWLVVNLSGGRTSAYMLRRILDANRGLPERTAVIFANTGKERPETLDFLHEIEQRWNVPVVWLEYIYRQERPKHHYRIVDYETACRNGEPFELLIALRKSLPTVKQRFCTEELKVDTISRYMRRELRQKYYVNLLGIRYDEPSRWVKAIQEQCRVEYPLVHARVTLPEIESFWRESPFDLAIPSDWSNCDLCFLKGRRRLVEYMRRFPEASKRWSGHEEKVQHHARRRLLRKPEMAQFSRRHSYAQLQDLADRQLVIFDGTEEESVSCFCTD